MIRLAIVRFDSFTVVHCSDQNRATIPEKFFFFFAMYFEGIGRVSSASVFFQFGELYSCLRYKCFNGGDSSFIAVAGEIPLPLLLLFARYPERDIKAQLLPSTLFSGLISVGESSGKSLAEDSELTGMGMGICMSICMSMSVFS